MVIEPPVADRAGFSGVVLCTSVATSRRRSSNVPELLTSDAVDAALAVGVAQLTHVTEYWGFGVRLDVLRAFFEAHGAGVLAHRFGDLRLRHWLLQRGPTRFCVPDQWAYFYDDDSPSHAHAATSGSPEDDTQDEQVARRYGIDKAAVGCMRCAAEMARIIELDEDCDDGDDGGDGTTPIRTQPKRGQQLAFDLLVKRQMEAMSKWNGQALPSANREAYEAAIHLVAKQVLAGKM